MSTTTKSFRLPIGLLAIAAIAGGAGYAYWRGWLPLESWRLASASSSAAEEDEHDHHDHGNPNVLELSPQALASLDVQTLKLKPTDYERMVRVPGEIVDIQGVTHQSLTAKSSGEVSRVYVLQGQVVEPGEPLFEISLTHEEAIEKQLELLEALAKLEVANAEIERLETLNQQSPGAVPGSRLLQQRYEQRHLYHTINSRAQLLALLGLSQESIDDLIRRHQAQHEGSGREPNDEHGSVPLIDKVTITAPHPKPATTSPQPTTGTPESTASSESNENPQPAPQSTAEPPTTFVMEELNVQPGQHVDVGDALCRLGNYQKLRIEGDVFERDLDLVRQAMRQNWTVSVTIEGVEAERRKLTGLPILYVAPSIDPATGSASFFVEIDNQLREQRRGAGRPYADWQYRPGQRVELRIPVERFPDSLVVPLAAIAQDGLNRYIFQKSGQTFVRRPVTVRHSDADVAVLADPEGVLTGITIAATDAYQLQLALLNRQQGPVDPHAGHNH